MSDVIVTPESGNSGTGWIAFMVFIIFLGLLGIFGYSEGWFFATPTSVTQTPTTNVTITNPAPVIMPTQTTTSSQTPGPTAFLGGTRSSRF